MPAEAQRAKIRELNDAFRKAMDHRLGRVMMTAGVDALPSDVKAVVIRRVETFSDFNTDNDPHDEHDFGSFELSLAASSSSSWTTMMPTCSTARRTRLTKP